MTIIFFMTYKKSYRTTNHTILKIPQSHFQFPTHATRRFHVSPALHEYHAEQPIDISILDLYNPVIISVGDLTKATANRAGEFFHYKPWMYRINPELTALHERFYSKQGCLFVSNLRYPSRHRIIGRNANITFDYRCLFCSGHVMGYKRPPPYDEDLPCHDVMKGLCKLARLVDVAVFRRKSDGVLVMQDDWSWETLGWEEEVEAIYRHETETGMQHLVRRGRYHRANLRLIEYI